MSIEQCADDSASVIVEEQSNGVMAWKVRAADASIEILGDTVASNTVKGLRVAPGPGLTRAADGKPAWRVAEARRLRSSAGAHTDLNVGHGGVLLQELKGTVTNSTAAARDLLVQFHCPWVDIVEVNNPAAAASMQFAFGPTASTFFEMGQMLHDYSATPRRSRVPGGTYLECQPVPAGATWELSVRVMTSCAYGLPATYSPTVPGLRIDAWWLGGG